MTCTRLVLESLWFDGDGLFWIILAAVCAPFAAWGLTAIYYRSRYRWQIREHLRFETGLHDAR